MVEHAVNLHIETLQDQESRVQRFGDFSSPGRNPPLRVKICLDRTPCFPILALRTVRIASTAFRQPLLFKHARHSFSGDQVDAGNPELEAGILQGGTAICSMSPAVCVHVYSPMGILYTSFDARRLTTSKPNNPVCMASNQHIDERYLRFETSYPLPAQISVPLQVNVSNGIC